MLRGLDTVTYSSSDLYTKLGLSINSSTGAITGTLAANADTGSPYSITLTATDTTISATSTKTFTWNITAQDVAPPAGWTPAAQGPFEGRDTYLRRERARVANAADNAQAEVTAFTNLYNTQATYLAAVIYAYPTNFYTRLDFVIITTQMSAYSAQISTWSEWRDNLNIYFDKLTAGIADANPIV